MNHPSVKQQIAAGVAPRSKDGLIGRNAVDMRDKVFAGWRGVAQGSCGFWWFDGACGHRVTLSGPRVRKAARHGKVIPCPACSGAKP